MIALVLTLTGGIPPQDTDSILREIGAKAAEVRSLSADYEETKFLSLLNEEVRTEGHFRFRKSPRTIRWESRDGASIRQIEEDRYVSVYTALKEVEIFPLDKRSRNLAGILGAPDGAASLREEFEITGIADIEKTFTLRLVPKHEDMKKRVREARLVGSTETYLIHESRVTESNGDTVRIVLQKIQVNLPIPARSFELDPDRYRKQGYKITRH